MNATELFNSDQHHEHQVLIELEAARATIASVVPDFENAMRHINMAAEFCRLLVPVAEKRRRNFAPVIETNLTKITP